VTECAFGFLAGCEEGRVAKSDKDHLRSIVARVTYEGLSTANHSVHYDEIDQRVFFFSLSLTTKEFLGN